ncbi:MAG: DEAD/DEAH box helicase [Archaeoglobi archaeon]|nr:DEAD/DEAH box helicase [Archaeoglobi archaeon]
MEADHFFCPKCRRLKSRCICSRKSVRQRNLELFEERCRDEELRPLFEIDHEVAFFLRNRYGGGDLAEIPSEIPEPLKRALAERGIERLYGFQREAILQILSGKDVVIVAPTGAGKTEAFLIPALQILQDGGKGAIVYPTKALARDQLEKIRFYASRAGIRVAKFDGDSDFRERREVLSGRADLILTNPDMLDYHLRNTPEFREFVESLRIMVFDELHSYSGLLGTNIYWLMRRIERFSSPQIVACSATIANPGEFAGQLFEREFKVVSYSESFGERNVVMVYGNLYSAIRDLVMRLKDRKVLVFGNSYRTVETLAWILEREGVRVGVHKAGLPRSVRERVERDFREGRLRVLVSTSTLELGIDIGDVDVVISELVPYPYFVQRMGRSGRRRGKSVGVVVMRDEDSIANYYRRHPEEYFSERLYCYVERDNEVVKRHHILSMAREMPIVKGEIEDEEVERLAEEGSLIDAGDFYIAGDIQTRFSMRGIGGRVRMIHQDRVIGERSLPVAVKELHPGAIVIHNRRKYRVKNLDLDEAVAHLEEVGGEEFTTPLYTTIPSIRRVVEQKSSPVEMAYCDMDITIFVTGYVVRNPFDERFRKVKYLDRPVSYTFRTKGFVLASPFPDEGDGEDYYAGSFHALEHVIIEASDGITGGGSMHMGGISTPDGYIFVYDSTEGGNGLSRLLFSRIERAVEIALDVMENCECGREDGCPRCTYSYQCGNNNQPLNRTGAIDVARKILSRRGRKAELSAFEETRDFVYYP